MDNIESFDNYLTVAQAAEILNISTQTLRRWDESGKLKAVRHPANGYRYYRPGDLTPFSLEYREALKPAGHFFQKVDFSIENNEKLREPQREAYIATRDHFAHSAEPAILQIPVGCGKTGVIASLPFRLADGRVLILTPNLTILEVVREALDVANRKKCFWRKTGILQDLSEGPFYAVLDGKNANLHHCNDSHFVITNIQQLASTSDRWLPQFPPDYFSMILVDEGHHNVAPSWKKVFERFPNAKVISLTATPFRSDGQRPEGVVIYRYSFTKAMLKGYIKNIHAVNAEPAELSFTYEGSSQRYSLEEVLKLREEAWFNRGVALARECNEHIVDVSINQMLAMREATGFHHQIIAATCSIDHARQVAGLYEERGYSAKAIWGDLKEEEKEQIKAELSRGKLDCIVQVQMLGEGFDHPPLSIGAIFRPYRSLSAYIQFVGRIMRVNHQDSPDHPDNQGVVVSHVGLNQEEHWEDFKEFDRNDQIKVREWVTQNPSSSETSGKGKPRRFDEGMKVQNEILGRLTSDSFLDPNDSTAIEILLDREVPGTGLKMRDLVSADDLRQKLKEKQEALVAKHEKIPVSPQRRAISLRALLNSRSKSVAARVVDELNFPVNGREIGRIEKRVAGKDNLSAAIELMAIKIKEFRKGKKRSQLTIAEMEETIENLDLLGDQIVASLKEGLWQK